VVERASLLDRTLPFTKLALRDLPVWLVGMFLVFVWSSPFVWMVTTSLKPSALIMTTDVQWIPDTVTFENYARVLLEHPVARWALNSVIQATIATFLCVLFGAMAGYALARLRFRGRGAIFTIFVASLMIPPEIAVVPMLIAFIQVGWANTYQALILPMIANVFSVYIFRQFFLGFPRELEEAAIIDGAGRFQIFFRIALPLARAPIIAATVIIFTINWNNFLWPLLVTFDESMKTMPVGIAAFAPVIGTHTQLESFGMGMAAVTLLSIPSLAVFLLLQKYFIEGITAGSVKG
jgi:multiple sugar transport system permease protein